MHIDFFNLERVYKAVLLDHTFVPPIPESVGKTLSGETKILFSFCMSKMLNSDSAIGDSCYLQN